MWQERQAELLRDEIEAVLAPLSDVVSLHDLVKEPLVKPSQSLHRHHQNFPEENRVDSRKRVYEFPKKSHSKPKHKHHQKRRKIRSLSEINQKYSSRKKK